MKPSHQTALAFVASVAVGLALRTRDVFFVDGAPRCLTVYKQPGLHFHPNNHLLYLVDVFGWTQLLSHVGFSLNTPLKFVLAVDAMNGVAAAGGIAVLYWILLRVTGSWKLSATICVGYGFTMSFLAQATNPNEPMVGFWWSFLAVAFAILSLRDRKYWPILVSGFLFALAMATYRSMVLLAPAAAVIIVSGVDRERIPVTKHLARLAVLASAFCAGCLVIFGWAYTRMGVSRGGLLTKFLHQDDANAYFDPNPNQWLKVPLGLVRNCFPVVMSFNGMRGFLASPKSVLIPVTLLVFVLWLAVFYCVYVIIKQRSSWSLVERTAVLAAFTGLAFTMVPLLTWNPHYGKFWLQPLACLAVLVAAAYRRFAAASTRTLMLARVAGVLFLAGVSCNLSWALRNRSHEPFEFEEARKVTTFVGDNDLVILDRGADSVSVMYAYLWADDRQLLAVIDEAVVKRRGMLVEVEESIRKTRERGGKVFFLSVLDFPKPTWDAFMYKRCDIPYESFDKYRAASHVVARFQSRMGITPLYELNLTAAATDDGKSATQPQ
jgi:hypothetical protein